MSDSNSQNNARKLDPRRADERQALCSTRLQPNAGASGQRPELVQRFTVNEVADAFGRSTRTIRSWIQQGKLECEKVGNSVFIRQDQVEAMLVRMEEKDNTNNTSDKPGYSKNVSE